jgi:hypothetical protein
VTVETGLAALGRVVRRAPYAYRTSWPLDEVELERPDGSRLRLLVKQLEGAEVVKPPFIVDPAREIEAYRMLQGELLGTPTCYADGRWWIALERVAGVELWQCDDLNAWRAAARWAARLHARFEARSLPRGHLLRHDAAYYRRWIHRARALLGERIVPLLPAAEIAVGRLTALPATLIHGELYASNVIVAGARVAPVDWEMAAVGPGVTDLAALLSGWGAAEQDALMSAYGAVDPADVAAARLQLALQWLGWAKDWEAPAQHRHDWLQEARIAAETLR